MIDAHTAPQVPGWRHTYSGKVRDVYTDDSGRLLIVASDRVSAYDHVLATEIPDKGIILTAMSLWWFDVLAHGLGELAPVPVANHLISTDVPAVVAGRAMICRSLDMLPIEAVARGYLTGSGLADYRRTGQVCGVPLPAGLLDGSRLPEPVFTPASKAAYGEHDENIGYPDVVERIGRPLAEQVRELTVRIYSLAAGIARERGIIVADTKLEFGLSGGHELVLADEVLTPDSSRFWPAEEWEPGRAQPSFDKQIVRDWLTSPASGWRRESGQPPPALPGDVVDRTRQRYVAAYQRLTGRTW